MIIEDVKVPYYNSYLSGRFFFPSNGKTRYPIVCKVHGLIAKPLKDEEEFAQMLTEKNIAFFVFHFTGYQGSPGETSIQMELSNLDAVITYLTNHPRVDPLNMGIFAQSMGAAISICHAARDSRIIALALQAPLYDFSFMVDYPEFSSLCEGLSLAGELTLPKEGIREKLLEDIKGNSPLETIRLIAPREILIIAGGKDTFIPLTGIKELFRQAKEPKGMVIVDEADHNLSGREGRLKSYQILLDFFVKQFQSTFARTSSKFQRGIEA